MIGKKTPGILSGVFFPETEVIYEPRMEPPPRR